MVDHACLACGSAHHGAVIVTLHDGSTVSSYSEQWRNECEALSVLSLRSLPKRQETLANVEKFRGVKAADELRGRMLAIWNARTAEKLARATSA